MGFFSDIHLTDKEIKSYLILLFVSPVLLVLSGFGYSLIPGAKEIMLDRYAVAFLIALLFIVALLFKKARENIYVLAFLAGLLMVGDMAFLVALNGSRIEYLIGFFLVLIYLSGKLKRVSHTYMINSAAFVVYTVSALIFVLRGVGQPILSILLMLVVGYLVIRWSRSQIDRDELVEKIVEERTSELKQEKIKLQAAIAAFTGALVIIDTQGKIVLSNGKFPSVLGINYEPQSIGELQQIFGGSYDVSGAYKVCILQSRVIEHSSVEYKDKFLRVLFAPVYDQNDQSANKKSMGVLIVIGDVTEEELLDRARDEFFAIASHELRTPLTAIQGNLALVLEYIDSGRIEHLKVIEMLQDAMDSSKRLIRLVHDFLDVSRLEQGRVKFEDQKVDVAKLIQEVLLEYDNEIKSKKMTYEFTNNSKDTLVYTDEDRVKQVIVNIISNAVKYTHKGKISVLLQQKGDVLETLISDTGNGIDKENQKYLFRKFQQAGKNVLSRDTSQGTGLGLYISRLIIRAMGGDVYLVSSEPDVGSTFGFTLPLKKTA